MPASAAVFSQLRVLKLVFIFSNSFPNRLMGCIAVPSLSKIETAESHKPPGQHKSRPALILRRWTSVLPMKCVDIAHLHPWLAERG